MHDPRILRLARKLLPRGLRSRLDPVHAVMDRSLEEFAASLPAGVRVLDAGAGESPYRSIFDHVRYVSADNGVGDRSWDYGKLSCIADLTALPFAENSFDAAVATAVMEHVPEPWRALEELRRVLCPGARLYLALPQLWELHQAPHDYFRYTRYGIEHLLRRAGFKVVRLERNGGYFQLIGKLSIDLLQFFQHGAKRILWPLMAPVFGVAVPLVCYYLDKFDHSTTFSMAFVIVAEAEARVAQAPMAAASGVLTAGAR